MTEFKIVFAGPTGVGKTTAITAVSEIPPISTDVAATDQVALSKATTTVGFDYGQLSLGEQQVLRLYGTPGQERFDYLWEVLSKGALGIILLLDHSCAEPLAELDYYLDHFAGPLATVTAVIGVTRTNDRNGADLDGYYTRMAERGQFFPVVTADIRKRGDVLMLLDTLLSTIEVNLPDIDNEPVATKHPGAQVVQ